MNDSVDDMIMDGIMNWTDDKFLAGEFDEVNKWLEQCQVYLLKTEIILTILTATLPAKSKLAYRPRMFEKCKSILSKRGNHEELLQGLE